MYLLLPGHTTGTGLQLGKACCPCSRVGKREMFLFLLFLHFLSFLFSPPLPSLSSPVLSLRSHSSLSLGDDTK